LIKKLMIRYVRDGSLSSRNILLLSQEAEPGRRKIMKKKNIDDSMCCMGSGLALRCADNTTTQKPYRIFLKNGDLGNELEFAPPPLG